jgi:two-component system cell cycle response regulator DivK
METDKCILVFDDDKDLLDIFRFFFEDEGWRVHTFSSCDEVLEHSRSISPDLILMDNWIPNIGGIAATQLLKNDPVLKPIPVIYVSANNDIETLSKKAGADGFIAKPFNFDDLLALAKKLSDR